MKHLYILKSKFFKKKKEEKTQNLRHLSLITVD